MSTRIYQSSKPTHPTAKGVRLPRWERLINEGTKLANEGKWTEALVKFQQSLAANGGKWADNNIKATEAAMDALESSQDPMDAFKAKHYELALLMDAGLLV